ncbi:hypothetical protein TH63_09925 [Rufibacter radiotolerans]|uniref:WD40-like Beta Propeller Repeat n=1 Tax=Rufibacter radiotolerans TaxID=1379910 RepID=A0A0H4VKM1_9BACT|nr:WD40 repeat domain-containing protein [Rufibacter radiotolerans]AKQ45888.1 hypothetical protein TH63_09925 [Rufibacter radiotolerans]
MKFIPQIFLTLLLGAGTLPVMAQAIPDTEIFLVSLKTKQQDVQVGKPMNVSQRSGYDNQPSFTPDGKSVLYTSQRDGKQTDIYQYLLKKEKTVQLSNTPENEYSPLVTPDRKSFSVVRGKEQDLWTFPLKPNSEQPKLLLDFSQLVGYHVWYNQDSLLIAAFPDKPPMALYLTKPGEGEGVVLEPSIGRSLQKVPWQPAISYVVPLSDSVSVIRQWNMRTSQSELLIEGLAGSQDVAWFPDGRLLMAQGTKLYVCRPGTGAQWKEVADLASAGIMGITRLAVSPKGDYLAFVANQ